MNWYKLVARKNMILETMEKLIIRVRMCKLKNMKAIGSNKPNSTKNRKIK
tara:strand:+ start:297 stop:446 length:150 start_codon:yes stop_codon:yes gene_type:complete